MQENFPFGTVFDQIKIKIGASQLLGYQILAPRTIYFNMPYLIFSVCAPYHFLFLTYQSSCSLYQFSSFWYQKINLVRRTIFCLDLPFSVWIYHFLLLPSTIHYTVGCHMFCFWDRPIFIIFFVFRPCNF